MSHSRGDERSISPNRSPSPGNRRHRSRSRSRSLPRAPRRSRSRSPNPSNPGNNLYVTGLSTRVTVRDLERFFGKEGKVLNCSLVTDPRTKKSRGFGFVTMETPEDAERCIKYLNRAVLEGRLVTVEKAKRARGRTPTPGQYRGVREKEEQGRRRSRSYSPHRRYDRRHHDRDPYPRDKLRRSRSPRRRVDDYPDSYRRRGGY